MNETDRLYEQYEDAFFALLMDKVAEANGQALIQKNEELLIDPNAAVPEEVSKRCLHTIEKNYRKVQFQKTAKDALRVLNRVALWILIPIFMFGCVFAASEAIRTKTLNYIIEHFDVGSTFSFQQNGSTVNNTTKLSADTIQKCLPPNYFLAFCNSDEISSDFIIMNEFNEEISISEYYLQNHSTTVAVDTEKADVLESSIGAQSIYILNKENTYQIVWINELAQKMIAISGNKSLSEAIMHIAEKIILNNLQ